MDKLDIIYIGPMGYSGSTLLDLSLNQHADIQSVGEIQSYDEWVRENLFCSCKEKMADCSFWNGVRMFLPNNFKLNGRTSSLELYSSSFINNSEQYAERSYNLFKAIHAYSKTKYILDSSKNVGRLEKLANNPNLNIKIIHLVRNGKDVVHSSFKKKSRPSYDDERKTKSRSAFKTSIHWAVMNKRIENISKKYDIDKILLRYEDLVESPQEEISRILRFLDLPQMEVCRKIDNSNIHNISGSRWRYNENLEIKKADTYKKGLSLKDELTFRFFAGRKYRKYGYKR